MSKHIHTRVDGRSPVGLYNCNLKKLVDNYNVTYFRAMHVSGAHTCRKPASSIKSGHLSPTWTQNSLIFDALCQFFWYFNTLVVIVLIKRLIFVAHILPFIVRKCIIVKRLQGYIHTLCKERVDPYLFFEKLVIY